MRIAIPNLETYTPHSGIGRVIQSLRECWGDRVRLSPARFESVRLPILRNNPHAVRSDGEVDLVLLPQLTGAQALRETRDVPSVVIVHDVGIVDHPGDNDELDYLTRWSIRRSFTGLKHASHVVAVSDFTRDRLIYHLPEIAGRVTTIPDGVSESFLGFNGTRENSRNILESYTKRRLGTPLLIYVGTEHPRKNIRVLVEAFSRVKRQFPGAQLIKVGGPGNPSWREQTLVSAVDAGLCPEKDLVFLSGIDDQLLAHSYRAANCFVSASLYEGFGLPALEAMAIGTPVVVSDRGAFPEVVGSAGRIVVPVPASLADALMSALNECEESVSFRRARQRAESLSWSRAADRYLDVFMNQLTRL